jgi:hypothetical protein
VGRYIDDGGGHFRIEYRHPLGGVDSSAPPQFIDGSNVVEATNMLVRNGQYTPAIPSLLTSVGLPTDELLVGFGELPFLGGNGNAGQYDPVGIFAVTWKTVATVATISVWQADDITGGWHKLGSLTDKGTNFGRLTYITINQVVYFSAPGMSSIFQLSLPVGSVIAFFNYTLLTANLGCNYLGEMSGRLIAINVWQFDTPSSTVINYPYQVAWSADSEQYGLWDVLNLAGNPTGAGFNNLPDVEDVLTGSQFIGSTAYLYRQQGITEMSPLNSGIDPFAFNHMWASQKGVGCPFDNTMSQYGSEGAFVSDTDIYTMGLGGLQTIAGTAKQAIYRDIYASRRPGFALITPLVINGEPELSYILLLQQPAAGGTFLNIFWVYSYVSKLWTKMEFVLSDTVIAKDCRTVYKYILDGITPIINATYNQPVWAFQSGINEPQFYTITSSPAAVDTLSELVFPVELIAPFRDIAIDSIIIYTPSTDGSSIELFINGIAFTPIDTSTPSNQDTGYFRSFWTSKTTSNTFRCPQLTLRVAGTAPIGHVTIYGSQTPSRPQ